MKAIFLVVGLSVAFLGGCTPNTTKPDEPKPAATSQSYTDAVTVAQTIPFAQDAHIREAIRSDCALGDKLSQFIASYGQENAIRVSREANTQTQAGKVLMVEITNATGGGGGAWSGSKSVTIKGTLLENGQQIGNFSGTRSSGGGAFAGFKSTCAILGRCVKTLGRDVATWMKDPTQTTYIGE